MTKARVQNVQDVQVVQRTHFGLDGLNDLNGLNYLNRLRAAFYALFVVKSLLTFDYGVAALGRKVIDIALRIAIKEICRPRLGKLESDA